jgi:glycosyltransferase involved in cell wall biosynthesis
LIIVDDHSSDETFEIATSVNDPRIRCLRNDRRLGAEENWNRCLLEASGRYVKILPQDDLLAPNCLERQVAVLEADQPHNVALVFCARHIIDGDGRHLMERRPFGAQPRRLNGRAVFRQCLRSGTNAIGEPSAVLFRRDIARQTGGFDATFPYVIDLDYWLRLLAHGDSVYIPDALASFRINPTQWSVTIGRAQARHFSDLAAKSATRPDLSPATLDLIAGQLVARLNNVARLLAYRFMFGRRV